MDSIGAGYQKFAESLLIKIAAMTPVPQEQDFGNDFFCEPRVLLTKTTEAVSSLGLIQVKGGGSRLSYGGLDDGVWARHELLGKRFRAMPTRPAAGHRGRTVDQPRGLSAGRPDQRQDRCTDMRGQFRPGGDDPGQVGVGGGALLRFWSGRGVGRRGIGASGDG